MRPRGTDRVEVVVETGTASIGNQLGEWSFEEVALAREPSDKSPDLTLLIFQLGQDYADCEGKTIKVLCRWMGKHNRPISVFPIKFEGAREAEIARSQADVIPLLLGHIEHLHKSLASTLPTITTNYEKTLAMLSAQLEQSLAREAEPALPTDDERDEDRRERDVQAAAALRTLNEKLLPDIIDAAGAALTNYVTTGSVHGTKQ